jgi:hypothetical protein
VLLLSCRISVWAQPEAHTTVPEHIGGADAISYSNTRLEVTVSRVLEHVAA